LASGETGFACQRYGQWLEELLMGLTACTLSFRGSSPFRCPICLDRRFRGGPYVRKSVEYLENHHGSGSGTNQILGFMCM
jgi:hypothetical protein